MLKTNCKKVRTAVNDYIHECINEEEIFCGRNFKERLKEAMEWWDDGTWNNGRRTHEESPAYFLYASANVFYAPYSDLRKLVGDWLEETEEERNRYTDDEVERLFVYLIDRELYNIVTKETEKGYIKWR